MNNRSAPTTILLVSGLYIHIFEVYRSEWSEKRPVPAAFVSSEQCTVSFKIGTKWEGVTPSVSLPQLHAYIVLHLVCHLTFECTTRFSVVQHNLRGKSAENGRSKCLMLILVGIIALFGSLATNCTYMTKVKFIKWKVAKYVINLFPLYTSIVY